MGKRRGPDRASWLYARWSTRLVSIFLFYLLAYTLTRIIIYVRSSIGASREDDERRCGGREKRQHRRMCQSPRLKRGWRTRLRSFSGCRNYITLFVFTAAADSSCAQRNRSPTAFHCHNVNTQLSLPIMTNKLFCHVKLAYEKDLRPFCCDILINYSIKQLHL